MQDSIHNYYEHMINDQLRAHVGQYDFSPERWADITCVALNHLPPRYIRHEVDMAFYLSPAERSELSRKVNQALVDAIEYVTTH